MIVVVCHWFTFVLLLCLLFGLIFGLTCSWLLGCLIVNFGMFGVCLRMKVLCWFGLVWIVLR